MMRHDKDMKYTLIYETGDFRMIRFHEDNRCSTVIVQHHHHHLVATHQKGGFSWENWSYCWQKRSECKRCGAPVPDEMDGMLDLIHHVGIG